jgi:hypothetical protein
MCCLIAIASPPNDKSCHPTFIRADGCSTRKGKERQDFGGNLHGAVREDADLR